LEHELGIEGGTVVTSHGRVRANVYVDSGRVAAVTPSRLLSDRSIDASGLFVMPGMVDAHVHFMDPSETEREDFSSGSAAAAVAGVTTVVEHTHSSPVVSCADLEQKRDHLSGRSYVDFGLAAHAVLDRLDELPAVWQAGAALVKLFTCTTHGITGFSPGDLRRLFFITSAIDATCLAHCEEETLTACAEQALREAGRDDGAVIPEWRTRDAEMLAVSAVGLLAARSGSRVTVAHVSCRETLALLSVHRAAGAPLVAESCPQYLTLFEDEVISEGPLRKFTPPARARSETEIDGMWAALAGGEIDYIASDHAPATLEQKTTASIWDAPFGLPGIDTTLPILLDGAATGRISYERVVEAYSERPASLYGLHPRKGSLSPGSDADLILVDPEAVSTVRNETVLSRAGWSPYAGRTLRGRTVTTLVRGRIAASDGATRGDPGGSFVPGRGKSR
jgi:dihydroorotase (multifunctional complex type)